jgi:hypothetical protein
MIIRCLSNSAVPVLSPTRVFLFHLHNGCLFYRVLLAFNVLLFITLNKYYKHVFCVHVFLLLLNSIIIYNNKWERYVACIGEIFIQQCYGKTKWNRLRKRPRHRSNDNIKMDLNCDRMVWTGFIRLKIWAAVVILYPQKYFFGLHYLREDS